MPRSQGHTGQKGERGTQPDECVHQNLVRVKSDINDVDTDVLLYECSACRKAFTITDY